MSGATAKGPRSRFPGGGGGTSETRRPTSTESLSGLKFQQGALCVESAVPGECQVTPNINYFCHFLVGALYSSAATVYPAGGQLGLGFYSDQVACSRWGWEAGLLPGTSGLSAVYG